MASRAHRLAHPTAALAWLAAAACSTPQGERDTAAGRDSSRQPGTAVAAPRAPVHGAPAAGAPVGDTAVVTVYKTPSCGCCKAWVEHMRENGFNVVAIDTADVDPVKARLGVRGEHASCHTATIGEYVIEGHVPAADVRRLLAERPAVAGLAVPGMPMGSPGMEGPRQDRYDVVAFTRDGGARVYSSH